MFSMIYEFMILLSSSQGTLCHIEWVYAKYNTLSYISGANNRTNAN